MKIPHKLLYATGISLWLSSTALFAGDLTATQIAKNAYDYLDTQDSYAFNAIVINKLDDVDDKKSHFVTVKVDRPGKVRIDVTGDIKDRSTYLNDGKFTMIDYDMQYYGQLDTPKEINKALDFIFEKFDIRAPLAQLLYSDMGEKVKFSKSKNFGVVNLAGTECNYIAFEDNEKVVHVWIATGDKPLVKHYAIMNKLEHSRNDTTIRWDGVRAPKKADFVFKAPSNAEKITVEAGQ